jgi:putative oxidoreductase
MTVVRRIARPMLASIFVTSGLESLLHPANRAQVAAPLVKALAGPLNLPNDPELMVRANGATMLTAGTMLALGKFPRIAALALAASLVPTTYAAHPFWTVKDPTLRAQQKSHFLKNVALLGGVLLAAVDTAGQPGLAYRARHVHSEAHRQAALTRREARHAAKAARREARLAISRAHDALT